MKSVIKSIVLYNKKTEKDGPEWTFLMLLPVGERKMNTSIINSCHTRQVVCSVQLLWVWRL